MELLEVINKNIRSHGEISLVMIPLASTGRNTRSFLFGRLIN
jgi:hypothetical protein